MLRAIVIDDSTLARKSLISDINEFCPEINIVGEADGVLAGAKLARKESPQIIFLDVEMGEHNGFDFLDIIGENTAHVIFVTGSAEYAIKAFKVSAVDYLLKPIDPKELIKAVEKIKSKIADSIKDALISFHTLEEVRWSKPEQIIRIEAEGNYSTVYFDDGSKLMITRTLKEYDIKLTPHGFLRVHQSHLVNKSFIKSFVKTEGGYLLMKNADIVSVSVRKRASVMEELTK